MRFVSHSIENNVRAARRSHMGSLLKLPIMCWFEIWVKRALARAAHSKRKAHVVCVNKFSLNFSSRPMAKWILTSSQEVDGAHKVIASSRQAIVPFIPTHGCEHGVPKRNHEITGIVLRDVRRNGARGLRGKQKLGTASLITTNEWMKSETTIVFEMPWYSWNWLISKHTKSHENTNCNHWASLDRDELVACNRAMPNSDNFTLPLARRASAFFVRIFQQFFPLEFGLKHFSFQRISSILRVLTAYGERA